MLIHDDIHTCCMVFTHAVRMSHHVAVRSVYTAQNVITVRNRNHLVTWDRASRRQHVIQTITNLSATLSVYQVLDDVIVCVFVYVLHVGWDLAGLIRTYADLGGLSGT